MRRLVLWAALGATLFAGLPPILYAIDPAIALDFETDVPRRIATGFYPAERAPDGLTFAWTHESFSLTLPGLDRGVLWEVVLRLSASRPDGSQPELIASVDGLVVSRDALPASGFVDLRVLIQPREDPVRSTIVSFRVSPAFVPAGDPRALGAQVDRITVSQATSIVRSTGPTSFEAIHVDSGLPRLPARWWPRAAAGAALGLVAAVAAIPASFAALWLVGSIAAMSTTMTFGLAPYTTLPWMPAAAIGMTAAGFAALLLPRQRPGARCVILITGTVAMAQMLLLSHPDTPLGDALFHAHRFQDVLGGRYLFTSIAPGDYQFPYPIGLYLFASPFAWFTRSALENVALLRLVVVCFNAVGAALIYRVVARWHPGDDVGAVAAVAGYHFIPLSFGVIATGNLTNVFAQSLALMTFALTAAMLPQRPFTDVEADTRRPQARRLTLQAGLLFALATAAFLSHTSTFAVLFVQLALTGLALWMGRSADLATRRSAFLVLAASIAALIVSVVVYYGHFGDVYREAFARIGAETGRATEAAGGRTPLTRFVEAPQWLWAYYGAPMLVLLAAGLITLARHRRALLRPLTRTIGVWLAATVLFLVAGIITPVDMRHFYAALPPVAAVAGLGFSSLWRSGAWTAAAAVILVGWAAVTAWQ